MTARLAIVGAGWAGMAAAVEAARSGANVTVFEAARTLGGRARALPVSRPDGLPLTLDNGQHILIGAYAATLEMMQGIGIDPAQHLLRLPLSLPYPDGSGLQPPAWAARWPAPLNALAAIATARGWRWGDRWGMLRAAMAWQAHGFRCDPLMSVASLCAGMPSRVMDELIEPLCVSALNTPADRSSAQVFLRVMQDALFGPGFPGLSASDLLVPRTDLSSLLPETAARWLQTHHGTTCEVLRGARVLALAPRENQWRLTGTADGTAFDRCFDQVIWATAAGPAAQTMATAAAAPSADPALGAALAQWASVTSDLPFTAITTVYAWSECARLSAPMLALRAPNGPGKDPAQFVFDRGQLAPDDPAAQGVLAFVVSASEGERADIQARVLQQASRQLGLAALQPLQTVVEKRATFACTPGLRRPGQFIAPGLWAAGDHVEGPYPATLEGAVRSGVAAAQAAHRASQKAQG